MYRLVENYFSFNDERGTIKGLLNFGCWKEMNLITSKKGTIRGGHYHKKTAEVFYVIEGTVVVTLENIADKKVKDTLTIKAGDVLLIEPLTYHTFQILTDAKWINLLSEKNDESAPDIHRL